MLLRLCLGFLELPSKHIYLYQGSVEEGKRQGSLHCILQRQGTNSYRFACNNLPPQVSHSNFQQPGLWKGSCQHSNAAAAVKGLAKGIADKAAIRKT